MSKNKDLVKAKHPHAVAVKMKSGKLKYMQTTFYLIKTSYAGDRIGCGDTEAKAWKDAAEYLKEDTSEIVSESKE